MLEERLAGAGAIKASAQQSAKCCPYKIQALGNSGNKVCSEKHPGAGCVTAAPSLGSPLPPRQAANAAGHVGGPGLFAFKAQAPWHGLRQRTCPWQTRPPHRPWGQGVFRDAQSGFRSTPVHFQLQRLDPKAAVAAGFKGKKRDNDDVVPAEFAPALWAFFFFYYFCNLLNANVLGYPKITANAAAETVPAGDGPITHPTRAGLHGAAHRHASCRAPSQGQGDKRGGMIQPGFDFN